MRSRWTLPAVVLVSCLAWAQYRVALPGYDYQFPRDHFAHPEFQTEWWYYTGNLQTVDGHHFGFELTFFREALQRNHPKTSVWTADDLYFAHLALSDIDVHHFYHLERSNRAGPGIAGVDASTGIIWNGNWQVRLASASQHELTASSEEFSLQLALASQKPPVIHGENGISQKADGRGRASHYISLTRLLTTGTIVLQGKPCTVTGASWMDHEFFTHQLDRDQTGWDWLSLQFEDGSELMLFRIRHRDGSIDPFSAGTFVDPSGGSVHLRKADFELQPQHETWASKTSGAVYPLRWHIAVPSLAIDGEVSTPLPNQEMTKTMPGVPSYWEGAIIFQGSRNHAPRSGRGYLEMTGYDQGVQPGH